jgi:two-component system chemotaxis sensor kinase CheA
MTSLPPDLIAQFAQLTDKIALEMAYLEPGSDSGLLPLNCLLGEMEGLAADAELPATVADALRQARSWIDRIFETTGQFDAPTIRSFALWSEWMQNAFTALATQRPLPEPAEFAAATAPAAAAPEAPAAPVDATAIEESFSLNLESDAELLREFINESHEHLQNIELGVLTLEENPADADTLNSIFRAFHTFKGGSGFLNLRPVNHLAHELESLLDLARQQQLAITSPVINVILAGRDTLKCFVTEIERQLTGQNPVAPILIPIHQLIGRVKAVVEGRAESAAPTQAAPVALASAPPSPVAAPVVAPILTLPPAVATPIAAPTPAPEAPAAANGGSGTKNAGSGLAVKVDTGKLDALVDIVGELVISQSLVAQDPNLQGIESQQLTRNMAQLSRLTKDLQRIAMSLRMVPIRSTFQKMTRLVRDLGANEGKQVQLLMAGEDTELDRTIVEEISDPLVHMIRNSVDHGIERPEIRLERGKPALGTIHLRACHEGGNIVIEIRDDGGGLNKERIFAKAVSQGLISADAQLPDSEIYNLIFLPGFSTAEKVTSISGRGVGMDVVRRNIERLRGRVAIESELGHGSKFTIYLPLTLAIIDGLIVSVGGRRYILPTLSVRESFRPTQQMLSTFNERGNMVMVRGHLIPMLTLGEYFGDPSAETDPTKAIAIVVESNGGSRCLVVDQLLGKQEVVIKSLGETFKNAQALAGAAILGDGRVGLILDVDSLVRLESAPVALAA